MAFYKKQKQKINELWYPRAITVGKPVTTDQIADRLAELSTVTRGDAYAILKNLGSVMGDYMAQGRTVKLDGMGTYYYTAATNKQGVESADKVSASQIIGVRVRFIPEVGRSSSNQVTTRTLVSNSIFWQEWGNNHDTGGSDDSTTDSGSSDSGDDSGSENPLG